MSLQKILLKDSTTRKGQGIRIGLSMNVWNYRGDFSDDKYDWTRVYPGFNISLQSASRKKLQGQFNMGIGSIADQADAGDVMTTEPDIFPNQFFFTNFVYGDVRIRYHFLPKSRLKPYLGAGVGVLVFSPQDARNRSLSEPDNGSRPVGEEYGIFTVQAPLCVGLDWRFHPNLSVGLQYSYHLTGTDYLDNIGSLGAKKGKDNLQSLQFALYITPNPPKEELRNYRAPVRVKPVQPKDTSLVKTDKGKPKTQPKVEEPPKGTEFEPVEETQAPVKPEEMQDYQNLMNQGNDWIHQIIKGSMSQQEDEDISPQSQAEKEAAAIKNSQFIYYQASAGERISTLAAQYKVQRETLIQLNNLPKDTDLLLKKIELKIPDVLGK
ncbi:MAG: outer membrane beta-barrel protein [Bacteroidia bacterium]